MKKETAGLSTYTAKAGIASFKLCIHSAHFGSKSNLIMLIISKLITSNILTFLSDDAVHRYVPLEFTASAFITPWIDHVKIISNSYRFGNFFSYGNDICWRKLTQMTPKMFNKFNTILKFLPKFKMTIDTGRNNEIGFCGHNMSDDISMHIALFITFGIR